MNFCSNCGSKDINFEVPEGDHLPRFVCAKCKTIHYQNPRMIVGCIIEDDKGSILLAKRGIEPRKGYWNLPCGFLENNETVQAGAVREVLEETGAEIELGPLHTIYNLPQAQQVYLIFRARMKGNFTQLTPESTAIEFFSLEDIPWDDIAFSSNTHAIKHLIDLNNGDASGYSIGLFEKK